MSDSPPLPLSRFKVLDLTRVRAGPTAVRQLADWGAEVIKIEAPPSPGEGLGGPRHGPDFQNLHRNKRSLTLDLKAPEGIEIFRKLVREADVVVENYRPDVKTRLGIDYEALKAINPRLVYASISGFGQSGPYRDRPGFDQIAQGMGGLMSITGLPGQGPVRVGIPVADLSAGIFCAMGILVALLEREVSGQGQWVESSLLAAQIAMLDFQAARWLIAREVPEQAGNDHPTSIPTGVFRTRDGHINIASAGDEIFRRLCRALDAPELADIRITGPASCAQTTARRSTPRSRRSPRRATAPNGSSASTRPACRRDRSIRWIRSLPIRRSSISASRQPVDHPMLGRLELVGQAVTLSRTPSRLRTASPEPGEHSEQILRELGYSDGDIAGLRERRIV